jgi:hypothetical protein
MVNSMARADMTDDASCNLTSGDIFAAFRIFQANIKGEKNEF